MKFESKIRKIGNSLGVLIPLEVITKYNYSNGQVITLSIGDNDVITEKVITEEKPLPDVITPKIFPKERFNANFCPKHKGVMKGSCGCP